MTTKAYTGSNAESLTINQDYSITIPRLRVARKELETAIDELLAEFVNQYGDVAQPTFIGLDDQDGHLKSTVDLVLK